MHATNGILFNHESPRRGETFVTRKITRSVANILAGKEEHLYLGNLESRRDWGYAPEYVEAMWQIVQQDTADDFVIGTGEAHSVKEFVEEAFSYAGLDWQKHVKISDRYFRPLEVDTLIADTTKVRAQLNWEAAYQIPRPGRHHGRRRHRSLGVKSPGRGKTILEEKIGSWNRWNNSVDRLAQAVRGQASH